MWLEKTCGRRTSARVVPGKAPAMAKAITAKPIATLNPDLRIVFSFKYSFLVSVSGETLRRSLERWQYSLPHQTRQ
jgi:hypothetical protein